MFTRLPKVLGVGLTLAAGLALWQGARGQQASEPQAAGSAPAATAGRGGARHGRRRGLLPVASAPRVEAPCSRGPSDRGPCS